jgi:alpha-L-fucosidase 2
LWYRQPAEKWVEALPIGNGRLGAMIFGGLARERLQLNEETLWAGQPYNPANPLAPEGLAQARELVASRQYAQASKVIAEKVLARPSKQMPYQSLGDLLLDFDVAAEVTDYERQLDLDQAIASTRFNANGVTFAREVFASATDQVIAIRLSADRAGQIAFRASFASAQPSEVKRASGDTLVLQGTNSSAYGIGGGLRFESRLRAIVDGGNIAVEKDRLVVSAANSVTLLLAMSTSYRSYNDVSGDPAKINEAAIDRASAKSNDLLRRLHVEEYQPLFHRVALDLGETAARELPTDQRVRESAQRDDPALAALYFDYARFLLISCSRPGTQPATLQGLWNDSLDPPWGSKYTININTEMNYWLAEPVNLRECLDPLVKMVEEIAVTGARTAREMYGARGWVCHHNTDLWRATAPIDGPDWGMWPTGGAWLAVQLFESFRFNGDLAWLRRIYPLLKGSAQFFIDVLVRDASGRWLVTSPSLSPENQHPFGSSVCAGPTMDSQILRDLFGACLESSELLDCDAELREPLRATMEQLPPNQVGKTGQLQEWLEDWDEQAPEPHHRHISHLYGLFPSSQIDPMTSPRLAEAAKVTLDARGDLATGWAIAWRINFWARLLDGERAHHLLELLLDPSRTYPNLFDAHPPFQIDGNFGGASGIIEMLLQSHRGEIHLLPALPKAWPAGRFTGFRARGGCEVDVQWQGGALASAMLRAAPGQSLRIRYGDRAIERSVGASGVLELDASSWNFA